jgi:hypothetical protein
MEIWPMMQEMQPQGLTILVFFRARAVVFNCLGGSDEESTDVSYNPLSRGHTFHYQPLSLTDGKMQKDNSTVTAEAPASEDGSVEVKEYEKPPWWSYIWVSFVVVVVVFLILSYHFAMETCH